MAAFYYYLWLDSPCYVRKVSADPCYSGIPKVGSELTSSSFPKYEANLLPSKLEEFYVLLPAILATAKCSSIE